MKYEERDYPTLEISITCNDTTVEASLPKHSAISDILDVFNGMLMSHGYDRRNILANTTDDGN